MPKISFLFFSILMFISGYTQEIKSVSGNVEFLSKELSKLISKDVLVEVIAEGFQFTEGPLWLEKEQMLLVSDIPGNTIYKWTEAGGREVFVTPGGYTDTAKRGGFMGPNGLAISREGKLMVCQHGDRRIALMDAPLSAPKSNFKTLAGAYNGRKLNSPNDLFLTTSDELYFTDPSYGFEKGGNDPKKEIAFQGVYKMDKAGQVTLLIDSISQPNGIAVFPGGKRLLVSNSDNRKKMWYSYDISSNGSLANAKVFYDASSETATGLCDGFKIDKKGNVFASGPGGIWIFTKSGKLIGKIKINGATASNCALTPDNKTLFITANQYLLRVKMR